jgi:transposase
MSRPAVAVQPSAEERGKLEEWARRGKSEQRLAQRARIVLAAAAGEQTSTIADRERVRVATVSKWRGRFATMGMAGLLDKAGRGRKPRYDKTTERRVLAQLDEPPPAGFASWTGGLVAQALKDVSADHVWRVLRRYDIQLERRRSWCISTDPQFAAKAADIVALYLDPPENAVVLSVDEKPHIQALERSQGYLRLQNGRALRGFSHDYKRHGTTTLFAALEVATGRVKAEHYHRRRRVDFLDFMNTVLRDYPGRQLHVILDNLSTHKPKHDRWLARHPNVRLHFTPTHASWLNQIEVWFSILERSALRNASFTSPRQLRDAIDRFVAVYNPSAHPFAWRKRTVTQKRFGFKFADLCK